MSLHCDDFCKQAHFTVITHYTGNGDVVKRYSRLVQPTHLSSSPQWFLQQLRHKWGNVISTRRLLVNY